MTEPSVEQIPNSQSEGDTALVDNQPADAARASNPLTAIGKDDAEKSKSTSDASIVTQPADKPVNKHETALNNTDVEGVRSDEAPASLTSEIPSLDPEVKAAAEVLSDLLPDYFDVPKVLLQQLNTKTTEDTLREYFSAFGEVSAVKIKTDDEGKSECFGFVLFTNSNDISKVMEQEHNIDGAAIKVHRILPSDLDIMKTKKLFVGGLAHALKEEHLRAYFETFGKIQYFQFVMNKNTNIRKTYCFVVFEDAASVDKITEGKTPPGSVVHSVNGLTVDCKKKFEDDHPIQQKIKSRMFSNNSNKRSYNNSSNYNGKYGNYYNNYYNYSSYQYGNYSYPTGYEQYYGYYGYPNYYSYPNYSYQEYSYPASYSNSNYGPIKDQESSNAYKPY